MDTNILGYLKARIKESRIFTSKDSDIVGYLKARIKRYSDIYKLGFRHKKDIYIYNKTYKDFY